jgi:hypothetical protein
MTAQDYPVEFGYGAQDGTYYGPKGSVGPFHRGNDRYTPTGTAIVIAGVTIAHTGATGLVSGPHVHTQAWTGDPTNTQDPTPFEFKPGRVVAVGTSSQWGKYVTVEVNGVNLTYAHLSSYNVSAGQILGQGKNMDKGFIREVYLGIGGYEPKETDVNWHAANSTPEGLVHGFFANNDVAVIRLRKEIEELKAELQRAKDVRPQAPVTNTPELEKRVTELVNKLDKVFK